MIHPYLSRAVARLLTAGAALVLSVGSLKAEEGLLIVRPTEEIGPIRPLNGSNNGPSVHNTFWFKAARISYMRTHDTFLDPASYGRFTFDVRSIFRDFSADENDPASYDFFTSDKVLKRTRACGAEILYRLGQTIEHAENKYYIYPPDDYLKWARICEHIISHYNEGWADGYHWNIRYWEIWNEPDLDRDGRWERDPRCWGGSEEEFYRFYGITSKYLKKRFPDLMIGGPGLSNPRNEKWMNGFLASVAAEKAPLDFFSWHIYAPTPETVLERSRTVDEALAKYGLKETESVLDEWNFVRQWTETSQENVRARNSIKGAAYAAATMIACQNETPIRFMTFYDFRPDSRYNIAFDYADRRPLIGYYPFYAWGKLLDCGTQVRVDSDTPEIYAVAAKAPSGRIRVLVCRYTDDNNVVYSKTIKVKVDGVVPEEVRAWLADSRFFYSDYPVPVAKDGSIEIPLEPRSFVMIEI